MRVATPQFAIIRISRNDYLQVIEIEDKIVSADIIRVRFCCDLSACKGICCIDGDAGAPLEPEEPGILEREYENYREYMTPEGREVVERNGFAVLDCDGELTTPLVNNCECAYTFRKDGVTYCAIEKACKDGKTDFLKPISCHLYPIRVSRFSDGTLGLNYHRWGVCAPAVKLGRREGLPMYKMLKEAIIRRFGSEFYDQLAQAEKLLNQSDIQI